jgi:hypothetical protein
VAVLFLSGTFCDRGRVRLEAVEAGPLSSARYLEPVGEINIHFGVFLGWGTSAAPAWIKG